MRAAVQNFKNASVVQGGSTITQQLVKNYYLSRERSLRRKFTRSDYVDIAGDSLR